MYLDLAVAREHLFGRRVGMGPPERFALSPCLKRLMALPIGQDNVTIAHDGSKDLISDKSRRLINRTKASLESLLKLLLVSLGNWYPVGRDNHDSLLIHDDLSSLDRIYQGSFPAVCREFVIPAKAGIQRARLDSVSSTE